jgi:acyl-CoA synthetase (AMP-forming)/AMP-acid ligase II/enoyl-CoA hydratase/carnithine racemase
LEEAHAVRDALFRASLAANEPVHVRISNQPLDLAAYAGVWLAGGVVVPLHRSSPPGAAAHVLAKTRARFEWDSKLKILSGEQPASRPILDSAALVVFTSGSSGMPKGAVLSHRAFIGKLEAIQSLLGFRDSDRTMLVLNITFSFGIWVALLTLLHGGCLLAREKFSAGGFLGDLKESGATQVAVVPTMMRSLILDVPQSALRCDALALRQVLIGGETLGKGLGETLRALFAPAPLIDIYGLTETSTCDFFLMPSDLPRYAGCIGRPSPGVRYRIAGDDGELQVSSPYLMSGYLDEPQLQPIQDGWLATGDLARERDPGVLEIVGRKKELIYRGGAKIAPLEIEFACSAHPKVAAALAVGRPDERLGQRIHALIVPRAENLTAAEVHAFLSDKLEKHKLPDVLYFARELPAGRTGKADRGRFAAMLAANELVPAGEAVHPMNKYESIRVIRDGHVAQLELHRPDRLNALGKSMLLEINDAMDALEADPEVRAIVLCGAGRGFSSGFDLKEQMTRNPQGAQVWREILELDFSTTMRFWDCAKPTIAAIHGPCMAGAFEMALACDLSVCSRDAIFGEPELKFGAGIVTLLLPWMVGPKAAKDILLTGDDSVNAERALALGIVSRVVEPGEHLATALRIARNIAVIDPKLVRDTKKALNRTYEIQGMRAALDAALDIDHAIESAGSPDKKRFMDLAREQGLKAALAWRDARFKG